MGEFNVFIAWSGDVSKAVGKAWYDWLPLAIQSARPWMSEADIDKGKPWFGELAKQLKGIRVGIICVTPDNLRSPSIHFEAGALSRTVEEEAFVCPYLFHVKDSDLGFPLAHFQTTKMGREDTGRLFDTLNRALQGTLSQGQLGRTFDKWWPELQDRLHAIALPSGAEPEPPRSDREILEEVLQLARDGVRQGDRLSRAEMLALGEAILGAGGSPPDATAARQAAPLLLSVRRPPPPYPAAKPARISARRDQVLRRRGAPGTEQEGTTKPREK
jgi:hypothetical protein